MNKFYKNDDEYLSKLSVIMAEEYQQITYNNLFLQVDCPDLALARHMNFKELDEVSKKILGMNLVTPQTSSLGKKVNQILICEDVYYPGKNPISEIYISILLDRRTMKRFSI